jgi:hypothetical protein
MCSSIDVYSRVGRNHEEQVATPYYEQRNKTAYGGMRDMVDRLKQEFLYFKNIILFHGTRVKFNIISPIN